MKVCDRSRVKDMKLTFIGYICFQLQRANFRSNGWLLSPLILGDLPQPVMSGCLVRDEVRYSYHGNRFSLFCLANCTCICELKYEKRHLLFIFF